MRVTKENRVLDKLKCPVIVKKFPAFYRIRKFTTAFTIASHSHWYMPSARSVMTMPSISVCKIHLNIILSFMLSLKKSVFPSCLPFKALYAFLFPYISATCLTNLMLCELITLLTTQFSPVLLPALSVYIFSSAPYSRMSLVSVHHLIWETMFHTHIM